MFNSLIKYHWIKRCILLAILGLLSASAFAQLSGYSNRFKLHINQTAVSGTSDLTNFPVVFSVSSTLLCYSGSLSCTGGAVEDPNGWDIVFTGADGVTILSSQVEEYDPDTGDLVIWLRFPTVSHDSDTEFYIYFGKSGAVSDPSSPNVWDSNYKMVLHLNEDGAAPLTVEDAAGEGTDGADNGTVAATGQIGGARNLNGTTDRITIADNGVSPLDISGSITISFWLNISNLANGPDILTKGNYTNGYAVWVAGDGTVRFQINNDALASPAGQMSNGVWSYHAFTRAANGDRVIYTNGSEVANDNSNASFNIDDEDFFLSTADFYPMTGIFDEVRISNTTRDADWIATEYNNQIDATITGSFIDLVNAEPILYNIEGTTLTYNSGDDPTVISSTITTFDGDDTDIESATIEITSNFVQSEDELAFADQNGITGSWDSINGILTLTGTSSVANYQTALQSVTYENLDPAPTETTRTISITINDGDDDSNLETRDIQVVKVNIAPEISNLEAFGIVYFAGQGQKAISNSLEIVDQDDPTIDSAFVTISSGFIPSEDVLAFSDQNGIVGEWDAITGVLTLRGTTTPENYQTALRSVTYENTDLTPTTSTRVLSIKANDGLEDGDTVTRNVEYPTTISELATYKSDGVFHYDAQDADGDGDSGTNQPADGSLSPWGDRSNDVGASSADISATNGTVAQQPTLSGSLLGGRGGLTFDGTDDHLSPANNTLLNTASYDEKSFAMVFRTGSSVSGLQVLYEQGGGTRGYQISINEGTLYAFVWNNSEWGVGDQYKSINLGTVDINTSYIIIASHDATDASLSNRIWEANLNGGAITTLTDVDVQQAHSGGAEIGEEDGTRDPVLFGNNPGTNNNFNGIIAEFISWNDALSSLDFTNIYAFLSDKWFSDPPLLAGIEPTALSFNEGNGATTISTTITVTDDDANLDSARVYISEGFETSEDVLDYVTALGISGSYNSTTGILSLTGSAPVADYQTALRAVTYQNTEPTSPSTTTREITFEVYDPDQASNTVTREVEIIPSNDAPVLSGIEGTTLAFTENDGPISVSSSIVVTDNDNSSFTGATVAFTNNYFLGEDELAFINANGIVGTFDAMTGILSLNGTSSEANYETALQSVTFENSSSDPVTALDREVTFRIFDGIDSSNVQTRTISVASSNTAPTLADIEATSLFYLAGDTTVISEIITLIDPDDTEIDSVMIQVTTGYNAAEDSLVFDDIFGITDSWNDGSGKLTLTGPALKTDFESAIRTVSYINTSSTPTDTPRDVEFYANDGEANSNTVSRDISFSIPKSVSGLSVWLKGDEGVVTSGSNVTSWQDQSGNGRDFTSNGTNDPVFETSVGSINSQNAIRFNGTDSRLDDTDATSYINGLTGLTIFFVIESDNINSDNGFWSTESPSGNDRYFSLRYDAVGDNGSGTNVITTGLRDLDPAFSLESFEDAQTQNGQIVMLKWTSETNYELYVDGVLSNPTFSQNIPTGTITNATTAIIGQGPLDSGSSWEGLIAEVILYDNEISLSDQETIEDYLSNKYDIPIRFLTPASGGDEISADDASIAPSPAYTTLSGPRVQESFAGEFGLGTYIFNAPAGFEWDTGSVPTSNVTPAFGGSTDLLIGFSSISSSQITFTITQASSLNPAEITFGNFRVRPTTGTLPNTGTITNTGTTGLGGSTNYGVLTMVAGTEIAMEFDQQPGTSNVNSPLNPSVRVQLIDQFNNPVEEGRVDIDIALNQVSGSGILDGASTTTEETNLFGIAEFDNLIVDQTGTYSLTASSGILNDTTSTDFDVVVLGQLTNFLVERVPSGNISDKTAGQNFNITIVAVDGALDTVDTFTGTISLTSNCTLGNGAGTSPSFIDGVLSSLTVSVSSLGSCQLTATNSVGSESGDSNSFVVTPGAPSEVTTQISGSPTVIFNDGFATSTVTVQVKDSEGNNVVTGGDAVLLSTTSGSISVVTDNLDGTYTATLTSSVVAGTATITGTLNAVAITDNAQVEFAEFNTQWQSQIGSVSDARNWNDATNWSAGTVPISTDKVLIPATPSVGNEQPVISTANNSVAQISIENTATVTLSGGINFTVLGETSGEGEILGSNTDSLTVGGNLNISDATVGYTILNGSSNQIVSSPNDFNYLELNNSNGANFAGDLFVTDSLKLIDGELFLPSGSNLIANSKEYVSGSIRMQREITGSIGWRLISSPFNSTVGDFLDGTLTQGYTGAFYSDDSSPGDTLQPNVLTYLESFPGTDNQRYRAPSNSSDNLVQGQGMFLFVFGDIPADSRYNDPLPDTLDVSGQEWNGDDTEVDFGITYTTAADSGWNLIGNPFAATIDWDDNANWTKTNVESTIYVWDPSANGGDGEYLTWNGVSGTLPNSGLIAPFQGFWVKANGSSPELRVSKDAKTTSGSFLRKENPSDTTETSNQKEIANKSDSNVNIAQIELAAISETGRSKRTNIIFSEEGRTGKDELDAFRLLPLSNSHLELHSILENGIELAINNLPLEFNSRNFIPIQFDAFENGAPVSGEFSLIWNDLRTVPDNWILTLIDNQTGEEIDMRDEISYAFTHTSTSKIAQAKPFSPSFKIRQKAPTLSTRFTIKISTDEIERDVPEEFYLNQNYPNPFNPSTTIEFGLQQDSQVNLEIWDVLGRKVRTLINEERQAGRYSYNFNARDLASGVYFYRLTTSATNPSQITSGTNPTKAIITKKMVFVK